MSGLHPESPRPTEISLHQASRKLELTFDDGTHGALSRAPIRALQAGCGAGVTKLTKGFASTSVGPATVR